MIPLVFHPIYSILDLPVRHRFPIQKYQEIYTALRQFGVSESSFHQPQAVNVESLKSVLNPLYVQQLTTGTLDAKAMRRIGFPWSEQLIKRTLTAVGGTILTSQLALDAGKAINLTGGYHHAFANFGSGFCMVNDLYLSALNMLQHPDVDRVLIFDCDVHQGDGTAKLAERNANVKTVSIHGEKNFPHRKQVSDYDFPLPKGTTDAEYLDTVDCALNLALNSFQPDAVIYDAGVDVHENDDLGHLCISTQGVYTRDKLVFDLCEQKGLPVAAVIGGGYQRDIDALVKVHLQLFKAAGVY
ncbi:histone deacetylase [Aliiglaciecola sp. 2_MG-2023]|uniref:histone deacetylase family protein n=1 Tax=Alteromonadaceae TaxID=72275 RepID=UPI0026E38D80|nr:MULTISPECIES: histone deacetylase [unclassified Aliiglaciecola]MDO6710120.1 histone deacetylase [Aliiglaciecola sp. 2_MG-2023]MDO6751268.1 histone deacetylase [Aliiglaciecola sp. 1_MG-2023]